MTVLWALVCIAAGAGLVLAGRAAWAARARWISTEAKWSLADKETAAYVAECFRRYSNGLLPGKSRGRRFDYYEVVGLLKCACKERDAVISAVMGRDNGAADLGAAVERAKQLRQERFLLIEAILGTGKAVAIERGVQGVLDVAREHQRQRRQMVGGPDPEGRWGAWEADVRADVERAAQAQKRDSPKEEA